MISGRLRDRVTIEKKATQVDSLGFPAETWSKVADVWGTFVEEKGSEALKNDRPISFRRATVYIRYRAGVTVQHRLKVRGATWEIENIRTLDLSRRMDGLELSVRTND